MLASCGVPSPNPQLLSATCPAPIETSPATAQTDGSIFIAASALPDCRNNLVRYAKFRSHGGLIGLSGEITSFAISDLMGAADKPWDAHATRLYAAQAWRDAISERLAEASNEGRLIIYIHGYNNDFSDVLERARILKDLEAANANDATVVGIHWPSRNSLQAYTDDEASIAWAQDYISDVVADMAGISENITIVSHSMGARALIGAVERLQSRNPDDAAHIRQAILISPDIDRHRVLRDGGDVDALLSLNRQVTIYTSRLDLPIYASRVVHGYSRLGSSDCRYDVDYSRREGGKEGNCHWTWPRENFQIIETSAAAQGGFLRHADVFNSCAGRYDLFTLLSGGDIYPWRITGIDDETGRTGQSIISDYFVDHDELCDAVDFYGDLDGAALDDQRRSPPGPRRRP